MPSGSYEEILKTVVVNDNTTQITRKPQTAVTGQGPENVGIHISNIISTRRRRRRVWDSQRNVVREHNHAPVTS